MLRRLIAIWNALTAAALVLLASKILGVVGVSTATVALAGILTILGAVSALASADLWRGVRLGAVLTLIVQGPQVLQLDISALTYLTSLPLALVTGLDADLNFLWLTSWRPRLEITPAPDIARPWIGVNLPALAAVVLAALDLRSGKLAGSPPVVFPQPDGQG